MPASDCCHNISFLSFYLYFWLLFPDHHKHLRISSDSVFNITYYCVMFIFLFICCFRYGINAIHHHALTYNELENADALCIWYPILEFTKTHKKIVGCWQGTADALVKGRCMRTSLSLSRSRGSFDFLRAQWLRGRASDSRLREPSGGYVYEQPSRINRSIWLEASQISRDGVWVNRSVREVKCKALWTVLRTGYCAI